MRLIETPGLYLIQYIDEDISELHNIFSDPETMRFYPSPFRLQQTQQWVAKNKERYRIDGFGLWAVCLKDTHDCRLWAC